MKQSVLLSQISLDHNKNNQATVIEEEKKKPKKMSGSPEAKVDDRSRWPSLFLLEKSNNLLNRLHIFSAALLKFTL